MKVLLVGHSCSPRLGSEPGITWNWACHLAQWNRVWLISHPQDREATEKFLAEHPNPNLQFVWVTLPGWLDPWNPAQGKRSIRLHYLLWQRAVLRRARRLHQQVGFDLIHHVSWGTVSQPSLLWRLKVPFVWGPVGGGQVIPRGFESYMNRSQRAEILRRRLIGLVPYGLPLRNAARKSALIFATNRETAQVLKLAGARAIHFLPDSGIREDFFPDQRRQSAPGAELKLLWVGRLDPMKGLPLALEAFALVRDLPVRLLVAGDGSMRRAWEALAGKLQLNNRVEFLGRIPYEGMPALYRSADAFIFTSLRDSFGSQIMEAMAAGLPIVTLNHQGAGLFVPTKAGIKVAVTSPRETILGLATALRQIASSPEKRAAMGGAAREYATTQLWSRRAAWMTRWYQEVVSHSEGIALDEYKVEDEGTLSASC